MPKLHDDSTEPDDGDSTETERGSDVEFTDKNKTRVKSTYYHSSPTVGGNAVALTHQDLFITHDRFTAQDLFITHDVLIVHGLLIMHD